MDRTPDESLGRRLLAFARYHTLTLDMDDATRLSVEATCRRAVATDLHPDDRRMLLEQLAGYLLDEIASHHG